jgi:hypothetical protein
MKRITLALVTTTKGHFNLKTRIWETIESIKNSIDLNLFSRLICHIKVTPGEEVVADTMKNRLEFLGFEVLMTSGAWSHGTSSHQIEYLNDIFKISNSISSNYIIIWEDDFLLKCDNFEQWCLKAIEMLEKDGNLMQVRIPRYSNEFDRINKLKQKHNLDRSAVQVDEYHFLHNDYSANPSFYRTRDIRNAVAITLRTNLPKHVEHGVGEVLRLLGEPGKQFACLNPDEIRIGHIGCLPGEEDDLTKPLNCD